MEKHLLPGRQLTKAIWLIPLLVWSVTWIGLPLYGDDPIFLEFYRTMTLPEFIKLRWETWSSRLFIDSTASWMCGHPLLYQVLTIGILLAVCYTISRCARQMYPDVNTTFVSVLLFTCYPLSLYKWAVVVDSIYYLWPLAFLFFNLLYIQHYVFLKRSSQSGPRWMYAAVTILCLVMQLFLNDQEQIWCCWLVTLLALCVYDYWSRKKVHSFLLLSLAINILSLVEKSLCPGNNARMQDNIVSYMPEFPEWSLPDKILIANIHMFKQLIAYPKAWILMGTLVLAILCFAHRQKSVPLRLCALYTFLLSWAYILREVVVAATGNYGGRLYETVQQILFVPEDVRYMTFTWANCMAILLWVVFCACIIFEAYVIFHGSYKFAIVFIALMCGYGSMMIMAFSPTIYASDTRTLTFILAGFLILDVLLLCEALADKELNPSCKGGIVALLVLICSVETVYQSSYLHAFAESCYNYMLSVG